MFHMSIFYLFLMHDMLY